MSELEYFGLLRLRSVQVFRIKRHVLNVVNVFTRLAGFFSFLIDFTKYYLKLSQIIHHRQTPYFLVDFYRILREK